jgi:protein ImuB
MARVLALWLPDWPLAAAGVPAEVPAIVLAGGRVRVCSAAARQAGVRIGLRRREAEARCPHLRLVDDDPDRDARAFAPVVDAAVALVPGTEVVRPGLLLADAGAAARAFGGEEHLADRLCDAVRTAGVAEVRAGIADTRAAAVLAARHVDEVARHVRGAARQATGDTRDAPATAIVPPGDAPVFIAPLPVDVLAALVHDAPADGDLDRLLDLLRRLGVRTLGRLAALPERQVLDRFGTLGAWAHRAARGAGDRPLVAVTLPEDLGEQTGLDPPIGNAEAVAFVARGLADRLVGRLVRLGLSCRVVRVTATTAHGEEHVRDWRLSDGATAAALVDRVRWQLDGWLAGSDTDAHPTAGIARLSLDPLELVHGGRQLSLTGQPHRCRPAGRPGARPAAGAAGPRRGAGRGPRRWSRAGRLGRRRPVARPGHRPPGPLRAPGRPVPRSVRPPRHPARGVTALAGSPARTGTGDRACRPGAAGGRRP